MEANNYTTVNITKNYQKLLKSQANSKGYSQIQYLEKVLYWFKISGMDPNNVEPFSPKQSMEQLSKKIDTVIKFIITHEKEKLAPLLDELNITNRKLSKNLEYSVTKTDLKNMEDQVFEVKEKFAQLIQIQNEIIVHLDAGAKRMTANHSDYEKNSSNLVSLMELLFEALNSKGITGGVKQSVIDKFNNLKNFNNG